MTTLAPEIIRHTLLSDAVVAYLGLGTAASPQRNIRAVEELSTDEDLALATRTVIHEVLMLDTEYLADIDDIRSAVDAHARRVCADLSDRAVEAIVWNYVLGWR